MGVEVFLQEVLLEMAMPLTSLPMLRRTENMLVHPVRDDYWLLKQRWLLGDSYSAAGLSAIVSPRTLANCPCICPRAFWQHPSVLSAESQLIMRLVNLGLSTTCLPYTLTHMLGLERHSVDYLLFPSISSTFLRFLPHLHLRQHEGQKKWDL